jgi:hypothetical protein
MRGLIGNMAAQPRVFGHDAVAVVIGAVNTSWPGGISGDGKGGVSDLISGGTGYTAGTGVATTSSASGTGLTVDSRVGLCCRRDNNNSWWYNKRYFYNNKYRYTTYS